MHSIKRLGRLFCFESKILHYCSKMSQIPQVQWHAKKVKIFSSSIVVDVHCDPMFSKFVVWVSLQTYNDVVGAEIVKSFREYKT